MERCYGDEDERRVLLRRVIDGCAARVGDEASWRPRGALAAEATVAVGGTTDRGADAAEGDVAAAP